MFKDDHCNKTKLDELFKDFNGSTQNHKVNYDWGEPKGKEIW